jgi:RNA polymerase sigma factor (TIGR02999 family)
VDSEPGLADLLERWGKGDPASVRDVIPLIYQDLRTITRQYLKKERPGHTLQSTALVHEVYLRLLEQQAPGWTNREEFLAAVGVVIRRVLVDYARARNAQKRDCGAQRIPFDSVQVLSRSGPETLTRLAEALGDLSAFDRRKAHVVELRFFVGLSMEEIAEALGISVRTAHREWTVARAWLQSYLAGQS